MAPRTAAAAVESPTHTPTRTSACHAGAWLRVNGLTHLWARIAAAEEEEEEEDTGALPLWCCNACEAQLISDMWLL